MHVFASVSLPFASATPEQHHVQGSAPGAVTRRMVKVTAATGEFHAARSRARAAIGLNQGGFGRRAHGDGRDAHARSAALGAPRRRSITQWAMRTGMVACSTM